MNRGELRNLITIERHTKSTSDFEDGAATWSTLTTRWAKFVPAKVGITTADNTQRYKVNGHFLVEDADSVLEDDRITWGSRTFAVRAVREIDQVNHWWEIEVTEDVYQQ